MATELEIHPIQADILRVLLFQPTARYSELNTTKMSTDHFTFHINRLVDIKLIEKIGSDYQLTVLGKEFANRFDTDSVVIERQAKVSVAIVATRQNEENQTEYLIQQRLKQPYFGFYGLVTGKIKWGETVYETAERELHEEANITATLRFSGIEHKMDYDVEESLLEDKYFFLFHAPNPMGELTIDFEGGKNIWLIREKIAKLPNLFPDALPILDIIQNQEFSFIEKKYTVETY